MPIRIELQTMVDLERGARVLPRGSALYDQGEICPRFFIILDGWVALSVIHDDGACQILDFALAGATLGPPPGANSPMYHSARCLTVVRAYVFSRRDLDSLITTNPRLAIVLYQQAASTMARAHDHLASLALRNARERIAHLFVELFARVRRRLPHTPDESIHLPLGQSEIGQTLGLTNVHVCRTLQMLRDQKIVRFNNHMLDIIDPAALITAAGVEPELLGAPGLGERKSSLEQQRGYKSPYSTTDFPIEKHRAKPQIFDRPLASTRAA